MPRLDLMCRASLPEKVVLPEPLRPATSTTAGFPLRLMSWACEPMNAANSSWVIFTIICWGFTAVSTLAPMALSFTRSQKSLATL